MKAKIVLTLLLSLIGISVVGQTDSVTRAMEHRIVVLEAEKGIREGELKVQTDQLKTDFDSLKQDSTSQAMTIWVAIAAGLGFLGIGIWSSIKLAKSHAATLVQDRLDKELPPMVQQRMEESFDKLLKKHSQTVLEMIGAYDRIAQFQRNKKLLILCEDQPDCTKMGHLVKDMGFDHVETRVANNFEDTEKYDLVIIAREDADLSRYKLLDGTKIWEYLRSLPNDRVVLYYGPRFERLDAEVREKIHFSNIVFTIYARIIEVFEYQHILETKKNLSNLS